MGRKVVWSPRASELLEDAARHLELDSPAAAAKLVTDTLAAAESLSELPERGRLVPELMGSKYREIFVGRYRLIYRVGEEYVAIVVFVHGARDFRTWWRRHRGGSPN